MHQIRIPDWISDGSRMQHRFTAINPAATALIVVDLQNAFVAEGYPYSTQNTRDIIPQVNRLAQALRSAGGTVAFLRHAFSDDPPLRTAEWHRETPSVMNGINTLQPGREEYELYPALDIRKDDIVADKYRYSAFAKDSSDLDERLRQRGIDTLIIAGTITNVCCETSGRDASMLGYRVFLVTDANAAMTDEEHNAALLNFGAFFGDIRSTDEIIALVEKGVAPADAA